MTTHLNTQQIATFSGDPNSSNASLDDHLKDNLKNVQLLQQAQIKPQVTDIPSLPVTGNTLNDIRFVQAVGQFYVWNGSSPQWSPTGGGELRGTAFPTSGLYSGLLFYRTDQELLYCYNGTAQAWVQK